MCTEKQKEEESSNSSSAKQDDSKQLLRNVSGLIFFIWLLYLTCAPRIIPGFKCLVYWLLPHGLLYDDKGAINWATFGDYFGALNCLFAGLAFAAVYVSIRQQSKSISIQQDELKAQLSEMANSVREAKEQNELQREYQFADEFYRRINLLKIIEKDIYFNKELGQLASLAIASKIVKIIEYIKAGDYRTAQTLITASDGTGLHEIIVSLDMFSVWTETFCGTTEWIQEHINQILKQKVKEADRIKDPNLKARTITNLHKELEKKREHYESILVSSTIWSSQLLLSIQLHNTSKPRIINTAGKYRAILDGATSSNLHTQHYLDACCHLLRLDSSNNLTKHFQEIHDLFPH